MKSEGIFALLKIEVCLFDGNREKISICYNECYKILIDFYILEP
jgi:hypothetical protein